MFKMKARLNAIINKIGRGVKIIKTMTCRQMGGSCDTPIHGATPEEMMNSGAAHVIEIANSGDEEHKKILAMMEEMQKNPAAGEEWNKKFQADFAALSED